MVSTAETTWGLGTSFIRWLFVRPNGWPRQWGALQTLIDVDDRANVLSNEGIGAFDLLSRGAMREGLRLVDGSSSALPFVLQLHGNLAGPMKTCVTHGILLDVDVARFRSAQRAPFFPVPPRRSGSVCSLSTTSTMCDSHVTNRGNTVGSKSTGRHKCGTVVGLSHLVLHCLLLHA